jgi:glycosyltransferase involved in cell wall biosynthesis
MNRQPDPFLVIVDPSIGRTGAFVCAQNMARALQGYIPALLVVPRDAQFSGSDLAPFVGCERLALRAATRALPAALAWLVALIPSGLRLRRLLAQTKATHLVLNDFYLLQGVMCRLLGFRGQIISWVRVEPKRAGGRFTGVLWRLISLSSNRVVAVSGFVQRQIPLWLKPIVLYDCLASGPKLEATPARSGRLVYLGNVMPGKGQDHAIEAFAAIADRFPQAVLEFHGGTLGVQSNMAWQQLLQQRCSALGLDQRISFHGSYVDPFVPLQGADLSLNFSESETFSFTVLESLSAGVPVIATNCGGPGELIDDHQTGVLVPIGDRVAMAQAVDERLGNLDETAAMGRAAARSMKQRFSMVAYQNQLLSLLKL